MAIITSAVNLYFAGRRKEIDYFKRHSEEIQHKQFGYLLEHGSGTEFGKDMGVEGIRNYEQFRQRLPVYDYDTFAEFIDRSRRGEQNVVWPTDIKWFAKSSGTTGSKSKFIPVTMEGLRRSHMRGPKDIMALYCHLYPKSKVVHGKMLTLGGSKKIEREGDKALSGDLSAILIENTPAIGNILRIPDKKTALIPDFDEKVQRICEKAVKLDVRSFTGVPSWNLVMLNRVLEYTGKSNILEVWPNMEIFIHGGMDFRPYEAQYRKIIPSADMRYMETYNASEGFFAIAEEPGRSDMLLMLDYGTFYEFLPISDLDNPHKAVPIEGVKKGVNYAMIITNCNGLWRYMIGDTVEFISTDPYTIKITGRTKHYVNAFGEEIVIDNAEAAMQRACQATGAEISEYTAAPIYMEDRKKGAHEWVVEFYKAPDNLEHFTRELDMALQSVNSDYEAKRFKDTTLNMPVVTLVPTGTFVQWLCSRGMVGGQNKVPRLFNDRTWVDQLIEYIPEMERVNPVYQTAPAAKREPKRRKGTVKVLKKASAKKSAKGEVPDKDAPTAGSVKKKATSRESARADKLNEGSATGHHNRKAGSKKREGKKGVKEKTGKEPVVASKNSAGEKKKSSNKTAPANKAGKSSKPSTVPRGGKRVAATDIQGSKTPTKPAGHSEGKPVAVAENRSSAKKEKVTA